MRATSAAVLALILVACSPGTADGSGTPSAPAAGGLADRHAESGLPVIPVRIQSPGGTHLFRAELAASPAEQARGLMFRTALGPDEAMIFPMARPREAVFWMKNTVIPLDLLFIGTDGRISNIAAMAEPYSLDPIASVGQVRAVLELAGGRAAELGITTGDRVEW